MSGVKVTNERRPQATSATEDVEGVVDGDDNVDWDPEPGSSPGSSEQDQWKQPVVAATTVNITIATALNAGDTLDGVTLAAGNRVLVKDQTDASENGIYVAGSSPERAVDMDEDDEVLGAVVYVIGGTVNAATAWAVDLISAPVVDTDPITWAAFGGGTGGGSIDVDEDGSTIVSPASAVDFRHGLDVTAPGGGVARIAVDEAELTYGGSGDIAAETPTSTAAAGAVGKPADAGHRHGMSGFAASSALPAAAEDGSTVVATPTSFDFRHGLDVTDPGGGPARIAVDEGELTHNSLGGLTTGDPHTQYALEGPITTSSLTQATGKLLGRTTATSGAIEEISAGTGLSLSAGTLSATGVQPGDDSAIEIVLDGMGTVLTTGVKGDYSFPFTGHIRGARLLADQSGSIVIDLWKDTYANYPPTVADTITASAKPTLSSASKSDDSTLTGWTTAFTAGDTLRVNIDSVTTIQRVTLILTVDRS